jgi:hypothetical protein
MAPSAPGRLMIYNTAPLPSESSYTDVGVKNDKIGVDPTRIPEIISKSAEISGILRLFC